MSYNSAEPTCELDSHADTCAFGKHSLVLATYPHTFDVSGFHSSLPQLKNVKEATVAVAYDCPLRHQTYILRFDHVLYIPTLETNLLCVDQLREQGIIVNETPLLRLRHSERHEHSHSILDPNSELHIPLSYNKPISYFTCRRPTPEEASDDINNIHVDMTSPIPWKPYDPQSRIDEENLRRLVQGDNSAYRFQSLRSNPVTANATHLATLTSLHSLTKVLGDNVQATLAGVKTSGKSSIVKADQLARRWRISIECARRTLEKTTQRAVRDWSRVTGSRRFRPVQFQLAYPRLRCEVYADVKFGPCKSLEGNICLAVYATKVQWARAYPLKNEKDVHTTLPKLFRQFGFPQAIIPDSAQSLTEGEFRRVASKAQVPIHPIEPYMHNQNLAEDTIREGTRLYERFMNARNIPKVLWDRVFMYALELRSHMALGHASQEGECGTTIVKGDTADISHLVDFSIYDWCWSRSPSESSQEKKQLTRWLGPSFDVGSNLCYAVLTEKGRILHRTSVIPLSREERNSLDVVQQKKEFTKELSERLGDRAKGISVETDITDSSAEGGIERNEEDGTPQFERYEDDNDDDEGFEEPPVSEEVDQVEFDHYISARVRLQEGDMEDFGVVKGRKRGQDGRYIGQYHENPVLDTSVYEVEFSDGRVESYFANQIVESIIMNTDAEGNTLYHVKEFVDHKRDGSAVHADDAFVQVNGKKIAKRTTKGWQLCAELADGRTEWLDLKTAKEGYPVLVAEYAVANKLVHEPAFAWWVPYTLKKRDRILKAVKRRALTRRKTEKFGLEVPKPHDVRRAFEIDRETGSSHWAKAMEKEVKTVLPALRILEDNDTVPPGYKKIDLMTVFDVKMDLTRKARICARGDQTEPPLSVTYASVVTRESIRLGFMLAALNNLKVLSADVAGAYLNAPCAEKVYIILGPEFGDLQGKTAIIEKALYGLRSAGFAWRSLCARTLREEMDFVPCRGDMDVWRRPARKANGDRYYEYLFIYTDDVIAISEDPEAILKKLDSYFLLKPGSIGEPTTYLGATISSHLLDGDSHKTWAIGSSAYLKESLRVVKSRIAPLQLSLKTKVSATMPSGYKPELDSTEFLDDDTSVLYMQFIGILRWLVELGRIDICAEVSMLSAYNSMPRVGHLHAVLHLFAYLQSNIDLCLVMDAAYNEHLVEPEKHEWMEFYPWAKDEEPPDMPEALGRSVQIVMFVDASHAANLVTRQSRTGVLIYVNKAPIVWYSKKQNSVETSSFGSEFMALKTGVELLEGLRYKLRMMGVPIEGYCHTLVDNMSVVKNTSVPESTLKKKSNSIAYHYVRSKCAADVLRVSYENTKTNLADMLTKVHSGPTRKLLRDRVMYPGDGSIGA